MTLPFVISVPHCSSHIPKEARSDIALTDKEIIESVDLGTREIFGTLPVQAVLCAEWARLVVDLNRGHHQRGPRGVIAQIDYQGRSIYGPGRCPDEKETQQRLRKYYFPFHHKLGTILQGQDIKALFDCHSLSRIGPPEAPDAGKKRKDIVLGNNGDMNGDMVPAGGHPTCSREAMNLIRTAFQRAGFSVAVNTPYSGGFITTHYGGEMVSLGKIAVQIEINQDLYLDRARMALIPEKLARVKRQVLQSFEEISREL